MLTNFNHYVDLFCEMTGAETIGFDANFRAVTADGITMINFGIGSPNAALIMDLLSAVFPPEVPALPAFMLQRAVSTALRNNGQDYWTGTIYTTNRRVWEHDEKFKNYLRETRAMGVDMETATLFSCGFYNHIPTGALLLVSDNPMVPEGIKTSASDRQVTQNFARTHVSIGIEAMKLIIGRRSTVRHLKYDW